MADQRKLLSLWICLLLMAALCPGAQYAHSKRKDGSKGAGKGSGSNSPSSESKGRGLSRQGLKWAGAAAGMLGGTGTGYGLGILGRPKHGVGGHHRHKTASSEEDQRQGRPKQSIWRAFVKAAAPAPTSNVFLTLGHVVSFLIVAWIRDI